MANEKIFRLWMCLDAKVIYVAQVISQTQNSLFGNGFCLNYVICVITDQPVVKSNKTEGTNMGEDLI